MPRGHRYVIFATFGFLVLATAAQGNDQHRKQGADHGQPHPNIAAPPRVVQTVSPQHNEPAQAQCVGGYGKSEDCTRASAQATIDQARYAFWQMVGGFLSVIVGLSTLGAAIWAAKWARAAAQHTETAAIEARRSADSSVQANQAARAWIMSDDFVQSEIIGGFIGTQATYSGLAILPKFKNVGETPALNLKVYQNNFIVERGGFPDYDTPFQIIKNLGAVAQQARFATQIVPLGDDIISHFRSRMIDLIIHIRIEYNDIFNEVGIDSVSRITEVCVRVEHMMGHTVDVNGVREDAIFVGFMTTNNQMT